jgi:hypothetical protein
MPVRALEVTADLRVDVDGVGARIDGTGSHLTVTVDDAAALASKLRTGAATIPGGLRTRRRALTRSLTAIDAAGLTITVTDAKGPLVRVGAEAHSRLARLVVANPHVELARRREAAAVVTALVRPRGPGASGRRVLSRRRAGRTPGSGAS